MACDNWIRSHFTGYLLIRRTLVTLQSWVCHLNYSPICLLALPFQNIGLYSTHGCGTYYKVQLMFISSISRKHWGILYSYLLLPFERLCLVKSVDYFLSPHTCLAAYFLIQPKPPFFSFLSLSFPQRLKSRLLFWRLNLTVKGKVVPTPTPTPTPPTTTTYNLTLFQHLCHKIKPKHDP